MAAHPIKKRNTHTTGVKKTPAAMKAMKARKAKMAKKRNK